MMAERSDRSCEEAASLKVERWHCNPGSSFVLYGVREGSKACWVALHLTVEATHRSDD